MVWLTSKDGHVNIVDGYIKMNNFLRGYFDKNRSKYSGLKANKLSDDQIRKVFFDLQNELTALIIESFAPEGAVSASKVHEQEQVRAFKGIKAKYPELYAILQTEYKNDEGSDRGVYVQTIFAPPLSREDRKGATYSSLRVKHDMAVDLHKQTQRFALEQLCAGFSTLGTELRLKQENEYLNFKGYKKAMGTLYEYAATGTINLKG
jgi:hypothetical protein